MDLESHTLAGLPPTAIYIADFITEQEEQYLLDHVYSAPKPKWEQLSHRRLQNWGGLPHPKGMLQEELPVWLENYATKIWKLGVFSNNCPNHVLVNEYHSGEGIMPHEDGPLFYPTISTINIGSHTVLDFYKKQESIESDNSAMSELNTSLNDASNQTPPSNNTSSRLTESYTFSLLLERRSLLVLQNDLYKNHLHGIKEVTTDKITEQILNLDMCHSNIGDKLKRETRVSLTIRNVPKVLKTRLLFGGKRK